MKRHATLLAGAAMLAMSTGAAYADCAAELERLEGTGDAAVDVSGGTGTQSGETSGETAMGGEQPATAEMEAEAGTQAGESVETSQAAEAEQSEDEGARLAALERARAALDAGDEQGCLDAIKDL
jgi:hypothetical protein